MPDGAFYVFPEFDGPLDGDALSKHLLVEAGVTVVPGSAFGNVGARAVRISYAASEQTLRSGLDRIEEATRDLASA